MAKDRQRRRKGNAGNPARSRARDMGLDDPTIDESGLTDDVPAPDPLKNVSAEVDQVKAAETGAVRGGPGDEVEAEDDIFAGEDDFERAPDEVEETMPVTRGPVDPAVAAERRPAQRKERGRILTFLRHSAEELRRVQWPDRKHVFQATAVVLGFCLIAGAYLGLMDALWRPVVDAIL